MVETKYSEFEKKIQEIHQFSMAGGILGWDMLTYMPTKAIKQRGTVLSLISRITHEMSTDHNLGSLLNDLEKESSLNQNQKRELQLFRRDYDRSTKLPSDFVEKMSKQTSITTHNWEIAKKKGDFSIVQADLEKLVELTKQKANYFDPSADPWDVLGFDYEANVSAADITQLFNPMKDGVLKLITRYNKAMESCNDVPHVSLLDVPAELFRMQDLTKWQMELLGMDPERSRCDESAHPFTTGTVNDVRITTHYLESQPMASIYSVFHEGGHALYNLNLPASEAWTYHGGPVSAGIHESQSRFIENLIGKNPAFLEYFFPKLKKYIPAFERFNSNDFIRAVNAIVPSKIRIYADEVTYNLHIILRFEMEQALFHDEISVAELPQIWNEKMKSYLNQDIINSTDGILQDTHWYSGLFGYFPGYALGNLYNGQMFHYMKKAIPDYEESLRQGKLSPIISWLKTNVHSKGNMSDPLDFIKDVTGESLNPHYFVDYLDMKYTQLYDL